MHDWRLDATQLWVQEPIRNAHAPDQPTQACAKRWLMVTMRFAGDSKRVRSVERIRAWVV